MRDILCSYRMPVLAKGRAGRGYLGRDQPKHGRSGRQDTGTFIGMSGTNGEPRWLNDDEQQAWRATVHLSQLLMRQLDRDLNAHGLNGHDYEILVELSEAPDSRLRMTELADATSQSRSRLSHQISRMEARGLVRRDNCEGDKRGTFAVLTDAGIDAIKRVAPDHVENVRKHFIDRLTPRQLEEVRDAFGPIVDYLRKIRDRD
jgi:DNA-binding MarR family transcriptional regulator